MLHEELRPSGITVTALCPGPVNTEFTSVAEMTGQQARTRKLFSNPEETARTGIHALDKGRRTVIPGAAPKALHFFGGHAPRRLWLPLCRRLMA
jgi:short-subunit dehydrogenase